MVAVAAALDEVEVTTDEVLLGVDDAKVVRLDIRPSVLIAVVELDVTSPVLLEVVRLDITSPVPVEVAVAVLKELSMSDEDRDVKELEMLLLEAGVVVETAVEEMAERLLDELLRLKVLLVLAEDFLADVEVLLEGAADDVTLAVMQLQAQMSDGASRPGTGDNVLGDAL